MAELAEAPAPFGYMAEFADAEGLLAAARRGKEAGYTVMEAYSPMPVHEVSEVLGYRNPLPWIVLGGGLLGAVTGFGMQLYASAFAYPINVGGRPLNSWPSFIIITFEMTILFAALAAVLGMLALNGLPRPHHPVFAVPAFERASRDRFFLIIAHLDAKFDVPGTRTFLEGLDPVTVHEVPRG